MKRTTLLAICLLIARPDSSLLAQGPVGQPPRARYEPSRPTVSPYLNLLRRDVGPLPNYHSLVRPQLRGIENDQRQAVVNIRQQSAIRTLNRQVLELAEPNVAKTGGGGEFRNYSHFYPSLAR